jgi:hypothetical protein
MSCDQYKECLLVEKNTIAQRHIRQEPGIFTVCGHGNYRATRVQTTRGLDTANELQWPGDTQALDICCDARSGLKTTEHVEIKNQNGQRRKIGARRRDETLLRRDDAELTSTIYLFNILHSFHQ